MLESTKRVIGNTNPPDFELPPVADFAGGVGIFGKSMQGVGVIGVTSGVQRSSDYGSEWSRRLPFWTDWRRRERHGLEPNRCGF